MGRPRNVLNTGLNKLKQRWMHDLEDSSVFRTNCLTYTHDRKNVRLKICSGIKTFILPNALCSIVSCKTLDLHCLSSGKDLRAPHDEETALGGIESSTLARVNCCTLMQLRLNSCITAKHPVLKNPPYPSRWQAPGVPDCFSWKSGWFSHFWYIYFLRASSSVPSRVWTLARNEAWQQPLLL